jgi:prepilin-type N-terminal cleavage/methylation domain-containing protein
MNRRSGFTLIELLVVIAIIAILAAILFPVFAQAKAAAKKTVALSDVKELALGALMYNNDYDDYFCSEGAPNSGDGWGWQMTWQMETLPYIKNFGIFLAPGDDHKNDRSYDTGPMFSFPGNGVFAYDCSGGTGWNVVGPIESDRTWTTGCTSTAGVSHCPPGLSDTAIGLPSESILFPTRFKMAASSWMQGGMDGLYSPWATTIMQSDGVDCQGSGPCSLPGQRGTPFTAPDPTYDGVIYDGWAGTAPFAMIDGHAKSMHPTQTVDMNKGVSSGDAGGCKQSGYLKMWDATRTSD